MNTESGEKWFEEWACENKAEFNIKSALLNAVSVGGVPGKTAVMQAKEQLEAKGRSELSMLQIRLILIRLTDYYGYVANEDGLLSLTDSGREVFESPFTHDERLEDNYVNALIVNADFV